MSALPVMKSSARRPAQRGDERALLIKLVHVGRRELGLDEATYRAMLQAEAGVASASLADAKQLQRVVDRMKRAGFKVSGKGGAKPGASEASRVVVKGRRTGVATALGGAPAVVLASDPEARKARAMWLTLHAAGQVRDPSEGALLAYVRRQTGVQRMEWAPDMVPVLEPLKAWLMRALPPLVVPYLQRPALTWAGHMSPNWHENWDSAMQRLQAGLRKDLKQLADEYVDLFQLLQAAGVGVSGMQKK
jgi:phage gp16-like protein